MVRTRIAPSPTGYPHIGTVYQALFDYAFARRHKGSFMVRIEDTDRQRLVEDAEDKIFNSLDWFSLTEDESPRKDGPYGPYRQSERLDIYKKYGKELVEKKGAYYCICTKERLDQVRLGQQQEKKPIMYDEYCRTRQEEVLEQIEKGTSYVIRLMVPETGVITVRDEIRGEIDFNLELIEDSVLIKSDGYPTYHFAVVVDDHLMQITHVVRGEEWLPSLPKHIMVYDYFGWEKPMFFHTPVLRNPDKTKLSKRHGHTSVEWYKNEGYLPECLLNFLALMGWSHPDEKEMFSLDEFIQLFDLHDLKPVAPIFDLKKLSWMNGNYIRELTDAEFEKRVLAFDPELTSVDQGLMKKFVPIAKTRMRTLKEFKELIAPFVEPSAFEITQEQKEKKNLLKEHLSTIQDWNVDAIVESVKEFNTKNNINFKYHYRMIIGKEAGLPLGDVFAILGKDKTLELLN